MKKEQIIKNNAHLGIKTKFFKAHPDFHGHIEDGVLFLNEKSTDIDLTNKYGILHFYEGSPTFKKIKKEIFSHLTAEQKKQLRKKYYINCALVFETNASEMIDREIAHAIILGDQFVSTEISKLVDGAYEEIISSKKLTQTGRPIKDRLLNFDVNFDFSKLCDDEKEI
ncbi:MAG: hypothetical protein J6A28_01300 [Clostridia bacterium]|nr:hypothetical protein [Clostridia bacterium]